MMYKSLIKTGAILVIVLTMVGVSLAGVVRKKFTLYGETVINGTVVKAGEYEIEFSDSENSEAIFRKDNKVVLKAAYKLTKLQDKASDNSLLLSAKVAGKAQTLFGYTV